MLNKNSVFVLDCNKTPCDLIHPAAARKLLFAKKAAILNRYPFTIILKEEARAKKQYRIKIDPGARFSGLALLSDANIVWCAELEHRGFQISEALTKRRTLRSSRRNRKTRYRQPRFLNRKRRKGWLPPSLISRVNNIKSWVNKLIKYAPVDSISMELVKFDSQKIVNPEIQGTEYQKGELFGYEVRQYLLEKFNHTCVYCGTKDAALNLDHFHPKSRGGSDRVSNLVLSCVDCNQAKSNKLPEDFLSDKPKLLELINKQRKQPLADVAAVNATRWKLKEILESTGLPVEVGSGALTKYNRKRLGISKSHWTDAACVGKSTPDTLNIRNYQPLLIKAMGHGSRQMVKPDKYGFPRTSPKLRQKSFYGFQTGDIVKAVVTKGKKIGTYIGRVAVRQTGNFNIKTKTETVQGISYKYCQHLHKSDGYTYSFGELVKQKSVNFVQGTLYATSLEQVLETPVQLNLFDISELTTETKPKTKRAKRTKQFDSFDGEQLSLF
ncbi:MAG: HNH endonuclease [Okeania sp. SIO3I5]|uniref:RNA-guided endonuclease IscB n=1 Tax=Okeania sp. SIO3I5 TaxID=2607805 RepID=UPI0013B83695|nr:RNA-guided endonuclease IscB [Okeania sp. SIO3I5]NEQ41026.1 HNH endonuclease [Okeania sp. SIO3I5]